MFNKNHSGAPAIAASGFSLIELCIVIIVSGLLLSAGLRAFDVYLQQRKVDQTNMRTERLQDTLADYVQANGHYPCPAPIDSAWNAAAHGTASNCNAAAAAGVTEVTGTAGRRVRIGALPARTLGLSDSYITDGWDRRFFYAVTVNLAQGAAGFNNAQGAITVLDASDNVVANGNAHYVLVSAGPDGKGAYSQGGGIYRICADAAGKDQDNCGLTNATFRVSQDRTLAEGAAHYDDFAAYSITVPESELAKVLACNAQKKFYVPGDPAADGNGCVGGTTNIPNCASGKVLTGNGSNLSCITAPSSGNVVCNGGSCCLSGQFGGSGIPVCWSVSGW